MRNYIPIAEIERRDPEWAERIRVAHREKQRRRYGVKPENYRFGNPKPPKAERVRLWRKANPEKVKEGKRRYKEEQRARYIVQSIRSEARQKGVRFDISIQWIQERLDHGVCELSGLPFDFSRLSDTASIDRRIPDGDYVEDNCRLILFGLNSLLRRDGDAGIPRAVARIHELRAGA